MPITYKLETPAARLVLTPTDPLTVESLKDLAAALAADQTLKTQNPAIEWRPSVTGVQDPDWRQWARHYDLVAWQVTSIFTTASVILAGGYLNARINTRDPWIEATFAVTSVGLILFQMFIVGAFRTYRYELYRDEKERDPQSPALKIFRKPTWGPWCGYCLVAWVAMLPWFFTMSRLWPLPVAIIIGLLATTGLFAIGRWARPPIL